MCCPVLVGVLAPLMKRVQHVQSASTSVDLSLPPGADEQSINFALAQLIMVMERLDTQIGADVAGIAPCLHSISPSRHYFGLGLCEPVLEIQGCICLAVHPQHCHSQEQCMVSSLPPTTVCCEDRNGLLSGPQADRS